MLVKISECNIRKYTFRWKIGKTKNVLLANVYCWILFLILAENIRKRTSFTYFKYVKSKMYVKVTEEEKKTYAVRSQMFECVFLIFFHNLSNPTIYENERITHILKSKF